MVGRAKSLACKVVPLGRVKTAMIRSNPRLSCRTDACDDPDTSPNFHAIPKSWSRGYENVNSGYCTGSLLHGATMMTAMPTAAVGNFEEEHSIVS